MKETLSTILPDLSWTFLPFSGASLLHFLDYYFFYFFERTSHATGVALPTAKESQTAGRLGPWRTDLWGRMEAQLSGIVWDNCDAWLNLQRGHCQVMQKQPPQHLVINHLLYWLHHLFLFFSPSYFSSFSKEQFLKTDCPKICISEVASGKPDTGQRVYKWTYLGQQKRESCG